MTKLKAQKTPMKRSGLPRSSVNLWSVQCGECFKWRLIPTQEEYEEIRRKIEEDPFACSKLANTSCNDPPHLEYDNTRLWAVDRPNLPKTPAGFHRGLVLRKDFSKFDCYYLTPNGRKLRASTEVAAFLKENPDFKHLSVSDFSFTVPKVMLDTVPNVVAKVETKTEPVEIKTEAKAETEAKTETDAEMKVEASGGSK